MADKVTMPIEATHIMMFARSVNDDNQIYYDADYAKNTEVGHVLPPPTFYRSVAQFDPDYFLRPKVGQKWFGSAKGPSGIEGKPASSGGLHAEQHFEYHLPVKPGDVLTVTTKPGKVWEKESQRAGKLVFTETILEYRNQDGELVVTSRAWESKPNARSTKAKGGLKDEFKSS